MKKDGAAEPVDEHKYLRDNYLECDLDHPRKSVKTESRSQSPIEEGILNPLSAQPLLSKTAMNEKTTQPGSALEFFKQRSSELVIGSATPTQHLYHSKQSSFKNTVAPNKLLP